MKIKKRLDKTENQEWYIYHIVNAFLIMLLCFGILSAINHYLNKSLAIGMSNLLVSKVTSCLSEGCGVLYLLKNYPIGPSKDSSIPKNNTTMIFWGLIGGGILSVINFPYGVIFGNPEIPKTLFPDIAESIKSISIYLFFGIFIVPFVEELFYRGCIYRILKNRFSLIWGYIGTAFLFTIGHSFSSIYESIYIVLNSIILTYLYEETDSITTSVIAHSCLNMTWFAGILAYKLGLFQ